MKVANMIKASCLMDPPPFSRTQKMKEAKILLVRPPHRESKKNKEGGPHPIPFPFSLAYACSMLERNKKACYIIDAIAEGILWEEFLRRCIWLEPDILVIEGSVIHIMDIMNAAKAIKGEINGRLKIILCGLSPTQTKDPFLIDDSLDGDGSFDFLLVGEYESTLLSLIECLERDECVEKVPGIIFRNEKKITANQKKPSLQNLDKLPWPHRRFLPMYNYQSSIAELPMPNGQIQISRHTEDPTPKDSVIRVRNPIDVAAEMEYLAKEYGFKGLHLVGPVPKTDWIRRLSMEIDKRGIKIPWVPREYEVVL
jgi:magnesium-protoporphyrin IX monomethyl ester (oxidative) cyclase